MNEQQFRSIFPNASKSLLQANNIQTRPEPEPYTVDETPRPDAGETINPIRSIVRITSFRVRPLDPDNTFPKFFVDALRYAGAISDDTAEDITLELVPRRVARKSQERTEIEVIYGMGDNMADPATSQ